jgi:hypothetical protein
VLKHLFIKDDKTDCSNCRGMSPLPTTYESLSNILFSRLTPYIYIYIYIIVNHQCAFRCNKSTIDQIFCILHILYKISKYARTLHHLFIDFKKAYESARTEVLFNIVNECGITVKLLR